MIDYVTSNKLNNYIFIIDDIDRNYIPVLYQFSELYIFPSYCEVFGLTNLEAMACGAPVITSNSSAIPEICGNAAVYFNPLDPNDIHNKIISTYENSMLKKELVERGKEKILEYSWSNTAKETIRLITNNK